MKVVDFLQKNSLEQLQEEYAIKINRHSEYPNLVSLNYNQIDSPKLDPIVKECRGLILDENDNWKPVAWAFERFFNYGEDGAVDIDWNTAKVYEKYDGSLAILYWYDDKWHVSTRGMPDASGEVDGFGITFKKLFWEVWNELGYELPFVGKINICYSFELMTPYNKIVVQHEKNDLRLIGIRHMDNLQEVFNNFCYNWNVAKSYFLNNFEEVVEAANKFKATEGEGYVVCDANFNRVKVKNPTYVALSHIKDSMSSRRMLEIVRNNEGSEFLQYFPEFKALYSTIKNRLILLEADILYDYYENKLIEDQKEFALKVKDKKYSGILFAMRSGKFESVKEGLQKINIRSLEGWLDIKSINFMSGGNE
jgi:hypothetical protein